MVNVRLFKTNTTRSEKRRIKIINPNFGSYSHSLNSAFLLLFLRLLLVELLDLKGELISYRSKKIATSYCHIRQHKFTL